MQRLSIILPAKNEAEGLQRTLPALRQAWPRAEIIVVDDGSTDATAAIAAGHGALVVSHPYSMGNGAAIKRGARTATGEILVFMDADGQHSGEHTPKGLCEFVHMPSRPSCTRPVTSCPPSSASSPTHQNWSAHTNVRYYVYSRCAAFLNTPRALECWQ